MPTRSARACSKPAGVAFAVHELIYARSWTERRGLTLSILLDQWKDGLEFEEVLVVRRHVPCQRSIALWRQTHAIVVQPEGGALRRFAGLHAALAHAGAVLGSRQDAGAGWRRLLGLAPRSNRG